jgi:hypothetical protein
VVPGLPCWFGDFPLFVLEQYDIPANLLTPLPPVHPHTIQLPVIGTVSPSLAAEAWVR